MSTATYKVEIAWAHDPLLEFRIGYGAIDTHEIAGVADANWTDETDNVRACSIRRGRTRDLGPFMTGTCDIELKDTNGTHNPANASSSLYPNVVPMKPVRVTATFDGTEYIRFYGYINSIDAYPNIRRQSAVVRCVDYLGLLQNWQPVIASTGSITTADALAKVLTACDGDPSMYDLDTGDTIPDFGADGTDTGLSLVNALAEAAQGNFYISREGKAVFEDRDARYVSPRDSDQSTMASTMQDIKPAVDVTQILNHVTVTKTGGVAQTAQNVNSQFAYGTRKHSLTSDYFTDDAHALNVASYILGMNDFPRVPIDVDIMNDIDAQLTALLTRDLCDRVGISETRGNTSGSYYIEAISEQITKGGKLHKATWRLSRLDGMPFIIGSGEIGKAFITY